MRLLIVAVSLRFTHTLVHTNIVIHDQSVCIAIQLWRFKVALIFYMVHKLR